MAVVRELRPGANKLSTESRDSVDSSPIDPRLASLFRGSQTNRCAKSEVLLHAMPVFSSRGIEATTVQDLLNAANISRRTFYKYFKNKIDVLQAVYKYTTDLFIARFEVELDEIENPIDAVNRCIDVYFDYYLELGAVMRMMQETAVNSESPLAAHRLESQQAMVSVLSQHYAKVNGRTVDPLVFFGLIWAMESTALHLLANTACDDNELTRCKTAMKAIAVSIMKAPALPGMPNA